MADINKLIGIRIEATGASEAAAAVNKFAGDANKAESAANSLAGATGKASKSFDGVASSASSSSISLGTLTKAATAAAVAYQALSVAARAVSGAFDTLVKFDTLSARLKTVTGSAETATAVFDDLVALGVELPTTLDQLADAFIRLKSRGFDTSAESLRALTGIAAATGRSLTDVTEAALDLAVGQTRRIEEIGISATQANDKITLSFGKTRLTIEKDAASINAAMMQIFAENFPTSNEDQMERLKGKVDNLSDAWDNLVLAIGRAGVTDLAISGITALTTAINDAAPAASATAERIGVLAQRLVLLQGAAWNLVTLDWAGLRANIAGLADSMFGASKSSDAASAAAKGSGAALLSQSEATKVLADETRKKVQQEKEAAAAAKSAQEAEDKRVKSLDSLLDSLKQSAATTGKSAEESARYKLSLLGADEATMQLGLSLARSVDQQKAAEEAARKAGQAQVQAANEARQAHEQLQQQIAKYETAALTPLQAIEAEIAVITNLAKAGLSDTATEYALLMQEIKRDELERANATAAIAAPLGLSAAEFEAARSRFDDLAKSADEKAAAEKRLLGAMYEAGAVSADTFDRAMLQMELTAETASKSTVVVQDSVSNLQKAIDGAMAEAGRSVQNALGNAFYDAFQGGIKNAGDFADAVMNIITRLAADIAAALVIQVTLGAITGSPVAGIGTTAASSATGQAITSAATAITNAVTGASTAVGANVLSSGAALVGATGTASAAIGGGLTAVGGVFGTNMAALATTTTTASAGLGATISGGLTGILAALGPVGAGVIAAGAALALYGDQIVAGLGSIVSSIADAVSSIVGALGSLISGAAKMSVDIVTGTVGAVVDVASSAVDAVGDLIGGIFHDGGIIGQTQTPTRRLPASAWSGAERYHTGGVVGLARDEVPIIARRGEAVVPLKGGAIPVDVRGGGGGSPVINIIGAPPGTTQRVRGNTVDVIIGRIDRELAARQLGGLSALSGAF